MDPGSILGILAAIGGVASVVAKSIDGLSRFKSQYREAPFTIALLVGQLCTIQTALNQLRNWSEDYLDTDSRYDELSRQVSDALVSFSPLIMHLQAQLDVHDMEEKKTIPVKKRVSFIWKERELNGYFQILDSQVNALTLLLQAVQCKTWSDQRDFLASTDSKIILRSARDCSSSVLALQYGASIRDADDTSEAASVVSEAFDFDRALLQSKVYGAVHRSNLQKLITDDLEKSQVLDNLSRSLMDTMSMAPRTSYSWQGDTRSTLSTIAPLNASNIEEHIRRYSLVDDKLVKLINKENAITYQIVFEKGVKDMMIGNLEAMRRHAKVETANIGLRQHAKVDDLSIKTEPSLSLIGRTLAESLGWLVEDVDMYLSSVAALDTKHFPQLRSRPAWLNLHVMLYEGQLGTRLFKLAVRLSLTSLSDLKCKELLVLSER